MPNTLTRWFENKSLSPFREFSQLQDSFDRLYSEFMTMKKKNGLGELNFTPSCEITENESNYVIKADMPGVKKDEVRVETEGDQLTIRAERKEEKETANKKKFMSEVYYGSYERTFSLPGTVDDKKVNAKFENGVLTVTVPKTETRKAKQIAVQ